jgi:hypothetical protein
MTAPARITQDDMTRAAKAVRAAGLDRARIVMDLASQRIEIIIGESASAPAAPPEVWTDEDV